MSQQPVWETDAGSLGTVPEGRFYSISLRAHDPDFPLDPTQIEYTLLAGALPAGMQVQRNGTIEGIPVSIADFKGVPTEVSENVDSKFTIRATSQANRINDRTFSITVTGQDEPEFTTPAGPIGQYFDGTEVDFQFEYEDLDSNDTIVIDYASGKLPPGLTISPDGRLTGFIQPAQSLDINSTGYDRDGTRYDQWPNDFGAKSISTNYEFTLQITDGKSVSTRKFSIFVYSRNAMTADTTEVTADSGFVTADTLAERGPYIINDESDIGRWRHDNFFTYQFLGVDPDGYAIEYTLTDGALPPGITLDPVTGWIHGYLPDVALTEVDYTFTIKAFRSVARDTVFDAGQTSLDNHTTQFDSVGIVASVPYEFNMTVYGEADTEVTWITDAFLGYIDNGDPSTFSVYAVHPSITLQYRLKPGAFSRLPQGLTFLSSGNIVGRTSFKTFSLDGGTTTFDSERSTRLEIDPTTFDRTFVITVEAFSSDGTVSTTKQFTMVVDRVYDTPYNILYAKAMPPREDRELINTLVLNSNIFVPELIYRPDDANFGISQNVIYPHAYGLSPATLDDYFASMELNHYNKTVILGEIKTARALDNDGNVLYEVVYSQIIDDQENLEGESVSKVVDFKKSELNPGTGDIDLTPGLEVYPNSFENMREQVVAEIGQVSKVLPRWMLSKQEDGRILGFTPAWVIAYVNPGSSALVKYRIEQQFGIQLNKVDFEIDRFTLDNRLTEHWDLDNQEWIESGMTTFDREFNTVLAADTTRYTADNDELTADITTRTIPPGDPGWVTTPYQNPYETIFDGGSTRFIFPSDLFEDTDRFDKYVMFPQTKIIDNT